MNSDTNLGTGPLSFNGGTLEALATGGGITSSKAITLNAGGGTFLADTGTTSILSATLSGLGAFTKNGIGILVLSGSNTYSGGTSLNGGILAVNSDANLGTGPLSFNGGTLEALASGGGITSSKAYHVQRWRWHIFGRHRNHLDLERDDERPGVFYQEWRRHLGSKREQHL